MATLVAVQNTELGPDSEPIRNVQVFIETVADAALDTNTASVVVSKTTQSDASGNWSAPLIISAELEPAPGAYKITRTYPAKYDQQPVVDFIIVPSSGGPYYLEQIVASRPPSPPLSESELTMLLAHPDPFPQYATDDAVAAAIAGVSVPATPDATSGSKGKVQLAGDLAGTAAAPTIRTTYLSEHSRSELGAPTADLPMAGYKQISQGKGVAATDGATVQNILDHDGAANPHAAAGFGKVVQGAAAGPPTSGTYTVRTLAIDGNNRLWKCTVAGSPGSWVTDRLITTSSTAPSSPVNGDRWRKPVTS